MDATPAHWPAGVKFGRRTLGMIVRQRFLLLGLMLAPSLLACWHCLAATFGVGGQVSVSLILATTVGVCWGIQHRLAITVGRRLRWGRFLSGLGAVIGVGVWALCTPWLSQHMLRWVPDLELADLESYGWMITSVVGLALVLPGCFLCGQVVRCTGFQDAPGAGNRLWSLLCGLSCGLLLTVFVFAPVLGVRGSVIAALSAGVLVLVTHCWCLNTLPRSWPQHGGTIPWWFRHERQIRRRWHPRVLWRWQSVLAATLGAACVAVFRLVCELYPVAAYIVFSAVGLGLLSLVGGAFLGMRYGRRTRSRVQVGRPGGQTGESHM
ncbi:MAG: hypothetical protein ABGZ17_31280, partial [Planctomycetaceae bacterium]